MDQSGHGGVGEKLSYPRVILKVEPLLFHDGVEKESKTENESESSF